MPNYLGVWPSGNVVLSFGLTKNELRAELDEEADPAACKLTKLPRHGLFEFTQPARAVAHRGDDDFVCVPTTGAAFPRDAPFADVTLVASDGDELAAHRVVLAVRAHGLATALAGGPRVSISLRGAALSLWIDAVYKDAADLGPACDEALADELLAFAHAHGDARLRALCEVRLARAAREVGHSLQLASHREGNGEGSRHEESLRSSVERLLALAERAAGLGAAQLLDVIKGQLVPQAEHVIAVCQQRETGAALRRRLVQACGKDFVSCLGYSATENAWVYRPGGIFGCRRRVPLGAYLAAGGQLQPGDPVPASFASCRDRELGGSGVGARPPPKAVRDRELDGYVLRGFDERLGARSVAPSRLVKLDLNLSPPYDLALETISAVSRAILPRMTETAHRVTAGRPERSYESYPGQICLCYSHELEDPLLTASSRKQLAEAYLDDIRYKERREARRDQVEAENIVFKERSVGGGVGVVAIDLSDYDLDGDSSWESEY